MAFFMKFDALMLGVAKNKKEELFPPLFLDEAV